jgi:hypothetical protein
MTASVTVVPRYGRVALLAVSLLSGIGCGLYLLIWLVTQEFDYAIDSAVYGALASVFVGLYIWARRNAYPALLTGLCAFSALWLLNIIVALLTEPSNVLSGAIGRAVILFFLIIGLRTANARKQTPRSV